MMIYEHYEKSQLKKNFPDLKPGDTVCVHTKIREGDKERIQIFEGVVIRKRGSLNRETFTVRKISYGVGVERIFPVHSPMIDRIEIKQKGEVRRSKLYYLRGLSGRAARITEKKEWELAREEALKEEFGGEETVKSPDEREPTKEKKK